MNLEIQISIIKITYRLVSLSILLSIVIGLRVTTSSQHIKDITFVGNNCMLCGQMFVHAGGSD